MKIVYILIVVLLLFMPISLQNSQANSKESVIPLYQIPVTLYNSQNVSTPNPFQQMIKLNETDYKGIIIYNGSFANFEFTYENGSVIPSWIESNNSGILLIWVKIISINAFSFLTIYLDIFSLNDNLLNSSGKIGIGEAPQLSPTYGKYDNGGSMFNFYDNFAGTSLNTNKWKTVSIPPSGIITENNGVSFINTGNNVYYVSSTSFTAPYVIDMGGILGIEADDGPWFDLESTTSIANTGYLWAIRGASTDVGNDQLLTDNVGAYNVFKNASGMSGTSNFTIYTLEDVGGSSGTIDTFVNYNFWFSGNSTSFAHFGYFSPFRHYNANTPASVLYWVRVRAYPPNGVMPYVSFGSIIKNSIENAKINIHTQIYALNISLPSSWGIYGYFNYSLYGKNYTINISNITDEYFIDLNISSEISIYNNTTLYYNLTLYAYKLQDYVALNLINFKGKLNITTAKSNYNLILNSSAIKFENVNNFYYFWNAYGYKVIGSVLIIGLFLFFISRLRRVR